MVPTTRSGGLGPALGQGRFETGAFFLEFGQVFVGQTVFLAFVCIYLSAQLAVAIEVPAEVGVGSASGFQRFG